MLKFIAKRDVLTFTFHKVV